MNINPNAKRILCFGDSNTWGYIPGTGHERYVSNVRWPGVLQNLLGNSFEVIEEGLNSRGIIKGDSRPGKEGRSAIEYIIPCLDTHDPIDYVIVCLGTNELKAEHGLSADEVGENLRKLLGVIISRPSQCREEKPELIIVVPPQINEDTEYCRKGDKYKGAQGKSIELRGVYKKIASDVGCRVVDIQDELKTDVDGIHMLPQSHQALGKALAALFI